MPGQSGSTASGQPSYEIDLPNAGVAYVIGNVIQQPSIHQNPNMLSFGAEGATNAKQELYVVNNTFLNDDSSRGNFILVGSAVTTPILMQNNIFSGVGTATNQSSAIDKTNYRSLAPAFVNRAAYDLRPATGSPMIDAGSAPGTSTSGVSLTPSAHYKHVASTESRVVSGPIDIGAYESAPAPAPAPADTIAPKVSFKAPTNGAAVSGYTRISVSATDNRGVARIVLTLDGRVIATVSGASIYGSWNTTSVAVGAHTLTATAYDAANNRASSSIRVYVKR